MRTIRKTILLTTLLLALIGLSGCDGSGGNTSTGTTEGTETSDCYCGSNRYNCSYFSSHHEAQRVYECCLEKVGHDVHRLDGDDDGVACEALQ